MSQPIIIHQEPGLTVSIDSDELELLTEFEIQEIISEVKNAVQNGDSDFFEEINYGKNPTPIYKH